jgi:polar amino acid transport system substrate-binding protein
VPRTGLRSAFLALLLLALTLASCRYPQDVEGTLKRVEGGVLLVGAVENPPWVIRRGEAVAGTGLEAELVAGLAEELGAELRWHWGTPEELLPALEKFQLDIVIGGLAKGPRIGHGVALTKPYIKRHETVGLRGETKLREHVLALPPGENAWMMTVEHYIDRVPGLEQRLRELERQQ